MPGGRKGMHEIYYNPSSRGEQGAQSEHEPIFLFLSYIDCDFLHLYALALRSIQVIGAQAQYNRDRTCLHVDKSGSGNNDLNLLQYLSRDAGLTRQGSRRLYQVAIGRGVEGYIRRRFYETLKTDPFLSLSITRPGSERCTKRRECPRRQGVKIV